MITETLDGPKCVGVFFLRFPDEVSVSWFLKKVPDLIFFIQDYAVLTLSYTMLQVLSNKTFSVLGDGAGVAFGCRVKIL